MELFSIPAPRWTSTVHPDPVTSSRKAGGSNDRVASTVTVRKGAISVGQDGILRGDWQSPRVPVANRHAACQAAPQTVFRGQGTSGFNLTHYRPGRRGRSQNRRAAGFMVLQSLH